MALKKKPRKFRESTLANWKELFPWMQTVYNAEGEEAKYNAYCPTCKITLKLKHTQLVRHQKSKTHIKLSQYQAPSVANQSTKQYKDQWPHKFETTNTIITREQDYTNEVDTIIACDDNNDDTEDTELEDESSTVTIHNAEDHTTQEGYISSEWFTNVISGTQDAIVNTVTTSSDAMIANNGVRVLAINTSDIILENPQLTVDLNQHVLIERQQHLDHQGHFQGQGVPIALSLPTTVQRRPQATRIQQQFQANRQSLLKQRTPQKIAMIQASDKFPDHIQSELEHRLIMGQDSDVIWRCGGKKKTGFNVHKFILAMNSKVFKRCLKDDEFDCEIFTPDFSPALVKCLLCLFYTGRTLVKGDQILIEEIKTALGILECPIQTVSTEVVAGPDFIGDITPVEAREQKWTSVLKKDNLKAFALTDVTNNDIKVEVEDNLSALKDVTMDSQNTNDNMDSSLRQRRSKRQRRKEGVFEQRNFVKYEDEVDIEYETEATDLNTGDYDYDYANDVDDVTVEDEGQEDLGEDWSEVEDGGELVYQQNEITTDRAGKKKPPQDNRDNKFTFHITGNTKRSNYKGIKSQSLRNDLFDGALKISNSSTMSPVDVVTSITVCHVCYKYFPNQIEIKPHMKQKHPNIKNKKGKYHMGKNEFKCPTCNEKIEVQHIVWFVKHMRYCGKDDVKAHDILGPGDTDDQLIQVENNSKVNQEDCYTHRPEKVAEFSEYLFGKVTSEIWGCRTCYEAFQTEADLEAHRDFEHEGIVRHGTCYDTASRVFTCSHCNFVLKKCHLVKFIHHRKQCLVNPVMGLAQDHDEEGLEDDTTDDSIDPWGVVNKPLRIVNQRSKWVCEALIGSLVPILYPCHVCYSVFTQEKDIKEHFRMQHPNVENCCENGPYYNRKSDCYTCPCCKKEVCRHQRNSIFFTHHMRKCKGLDYQVTWGCDKCLKKFTIFRTYTYHMKTSCETQDFFCHICNMQLKTRKDLKNHVAYVHSTFRPFVCPTCSRAFKRKGDLVSHQQSHDASIQFSCEHCGKVFNHVKKLKRHMMCHMSYMDRPHKCPHCTLRFMLKQKLENHIATHFDVKKFACDICDVRVKTKDALWAHRKKVHKLTASSNNTIFAATSNIAQPISDGGLLHGGNEMIVTIENDGLTAVDDLPMVAANIVTSTSHIIVKD